MSPRFINYVVKHRVRRAALEVLAATMLLCIAFGLPVLSYLWLGRS